MSSHQSNPPSNFKRQLHRSEEIFRLLVQGVKDYAIFMLDPDGHIMTWNAGAEHLKGYTADEVIGKHFSIFYTPEAIKASYPTQELEIALKEGRYEEEGWRIKKDGSAFWANVVLTAIYDEDHLVGFAKVTRDLTERKLSEERLRDAARKEQVFRSLVSSVKDYAIFMLDPRGFIMTWNDGAQRIKGYTAEEIIGSHFSRFYTEPDRLRNHPENELAIAREVGRYEEEGWRVKKDGTTFWANVVITRITEGDHIVGFAKVTRDLTERRLAEQARENNARLLAASNEELQRALETKGRFLSTISHEVRTPMGGIIGMAELLTMKNLGADNNDIINSIFTSSKRLLALLNDLLDTSRIESGKLSIESRTFPIRAILGDVQQLVRPEASKKGLQVIGHCDASIPEFLCGDEIRLRQVLLNLAFNAVKFTEKGSVTVSFLLVSKDGPVYTVRFEVRDTGIGIAPEAINRLFTPFEQASDSISRLYGGSGLGLSIAKNIVELMGGKIGVESAFGEGSLFWFEIPFHQEKFEHE